MLTIKIKEPERQLTISDLEQLSPCEREAMYSAAPHNPLGFLPVYGQFVD